jgi:ribosome biogenesis GTPase
VTLNPAPSRCGDRSGALVRRGPHGGADRFVRRRQIDAGQHAGRIGAANRSRPATIREHDAKGRHTTTSRSLHAIAGGGWVIDTPGMRTLQVSDVGSGIDTLFAEITELAPLCKFRDCTHVHEPGCAVQAGGVE